MVRVSSCSALTRKALAITKVSESDLPGALVAGLSGTGFNTDKTSYCDALSAASR
jgi:hypothetical protein